MTITVTIIVSAVTSGIVSIGTFVVGVRMAKDQGDRAALRQIYQRLFEHFRAIDDAIGDQKPKGWNDFPLKGDRYVPVFGQMQVDGEANLMPPLLIEQCEKLEIDALTAGGRYRQWVRETYIPALKALMSERAASSSAITMRSYRQLSAHELGLMSVEEIHNLAADLETRMLGVGVQVAVERGKHDVLHIYPDHLTNGNIRELLIDAAALVSADAKGRELAKAVHALRPRLATHLAKLKVRIRDPHPLYESILRSFRDAVRGG